jgi:hypothetical protein
MREEWVKQGHNHTHTSPLARAFSPHPPSTATAPLPPSSVRPRPPLTHSECHCDLSDEVTTHHTPRPPLPPPVSPPHTTTTTSTTTMANHIFTVLAVALMMGALKVCSSPPLTTRFTCTHHPIVPTATRVSASLSYPVFRTSTPTTPHRHRPTNQVDTSSTQNISYSPRLRVLRRSFLQVCIL